MMCEFHESTCNGFGDIWWTDNPIYFSSIYIVHIVHITKGPFKCYVTQMGMGGGVSDFLEKKFTNVECSMLLALRGGGWGSTFQENSVT